MVRPPDLSGRAWWVDRPPALFSDAVEESQPTRACIHKPGGRRYRVKGPEPQPTPGGSHEQVLGL